MKNSGFRFQITNKKTKNFIEKIFQSPYLEAIASQINLIAYVSNAA